MLRCTCTVRTSITHTVTNKPVTIPEVAVLQHLFGRDAVSDITPVGVIEDFNDADERERLFLTYEAVAREEERGFIDRLFPQSQLLPTSLRQIGVDPKTAAAAIRARAAALEAQAAQLDAAPKGDLDVDAEYDEVLKDLPVEPTVVKRAPGRPKAIDLTPEKLAETI